MSKPEIPAGLILQAVQSAIGSVLGLTPLEGGLESQVFRSAGGPRVIVRVARERVGFDKDAFAFTRFANKELPIPRILHIGKIEDCFFCVSEQLPGTTLQDLTPGQLRSVLEPVSRSMAAIAAADVHSLSGYGPFDAAGCGLHKTWIEFLLCGVERGDPRLAKVTDRFRELVENMPEIRALVHGDFGSNNVLTDGRSITGVIDWSEAMIGDPLYDVANIFFWRPWLACMEEQARFFERSIRKEPRMHQRLLCYQLRIGISESYTNLLQGRDGPAEWAISRVCALASTL